MRTVGGEGRLKLCGEILRLRASVSLHAHTLCEMRPINIRIANVEKLVRLGTQRISACLEILMLQNLVAPVAQDHCHHIEAFPREGPQCLIGIHAAAIRLDAQHLAIRTGDRGAHGKRYGHAD